MLATTMDPSRLVCCCAAAVLLAAGLARGEDSARRRAYFHLRFAESNPLTSAHDAAGASIGFNLGRHLGFEFAADDYERFLEVSSDKVGELDVHTFMPQVRLRYPLLEDRLVPYFLAGGGVGVTQMNDTSTPVSMRGGTTQVHPMGVVGAGVEYFLTDDIALGTEAKYFIAGREHFSALGEDEALALGSVMWSFGLRYFYPELDPAEAAARARRRRGSFYVVARVGTSLLETADVFSDVSADPEQPIFGSSFGVLFGGGAGVNLGRYASVEISIENRELRLNTAEEKGIGEYALFPVLLQPRLRYPLLDGRLEPYVLGGVGIEFAEFNDASDASSARRISAQDASIVGAVGLGFDYFVSHDISVGCELKYLISRGHELQMGSDASQGGNLDALVLSVGLRAHVFDW